MPYFGLTSRASSLMSPFCLAPISAINTSCVLSSILTDFAIPNGVLYENGVASTLYFWLKIVLRISFTLVFAKLPVIPILMIELLFNTFTALTI